MFGLFGSDMVDNLMNEKLMDGSELLVVTAIVRESKTYRRKRKRGVIKEYEELSEGCIKNGSCSAGSHIISVFSLC